MKGEFTHVAEAWYAENIIASRKEKNHLFHDDVVILIYDDGRLLADIQVTWYYLNNNSNAPAPCLVLFNDGWKVFFEAQELTNLFQDIGNKNISPSDFCARLRELGYKDVTPREG